MTLLSDTFKAYARPELSLQRLLEVDCGSVRGSSVADQRIRIGGEVSCETDARGPLCEFGGGFRLLHRRGGVLLAVQCPRISCQTGADHFAVPGRRTER